MAQAAEGRKGKEGGKIWKGFFGLDFSVRNPNHTGKATPGTGLKGREKKRRRRKIPIIEAKTTGH